MPKETKPFYMELPNEQQTELHPPIEIADIIVGKRGRTDYGDINFIAASIEEIGLIHPIVLRKNDNGKFELIAGGRRLRSIALINEDRAPEDKITKLYHGTTLDPQKLGYLFKSEVPDDVLREAELDENVARKQMSWQETVLLMFETHKLKGKKARQNGEVWGLRQTGALFGTGLGHLSYIIRIAELILADDKDIIACKNVMDAIRVILQRKQDEALRAKAKIKKPVKDLLTGSKPTAAAPLKPPNIAAEKPKTPFELPKEAPVSTKSSGLLEDIFFERSLMLDLSSSKIEQDAQPFATEVPTPEITDEDLGPGVNVIDNTDQVDELLSTLEVPLSKLFQCTDSRILLTKLGENIFDHIVTDPPYAIDMDNLTDIKNIDRVVETHDVKENLELLELLIKNAYRIIRPNGFLVMWCDAMHFRQLHDWGIEAGFKVQRWPFIWHKTHLCKNQAPTFNTTKNHEQFIIMRKGLATLRAPVTSSVIEAESATERRMYNNPFAKPMICWKTIYDMIGYTGQTVWDPFAGEMSACRAGVLCGYTTYGTEIESNHYNRGIEHMKAVYRTLTKRKVNFY